MLWVLWLLWLNLAFAASSAAQPRTTQVVVLTSFERHPFTVFTDIFRTELSQSSAPVNFLQLSIQPDPFGPLLQDEPVVNFLSSSLAGRRVDLVVSVGGPAAAFAQKYRTRLFPATPLLGDGGGLELGPGPTASRQTRRPWAWHRISRVSSTTSSSCFLRRRRVRRDR